MAVHVADDLVNFAISPIAAADQNGGWRLAFWDKWIAKQGRPAKSGARSAMTPDRLFDSESGHGRALYTAHLGLIPGVNRLDAYELADRVPPEKPVTATFEPRREPTIDGETVAPRQSEAADTNLGAQLLFSANAIDGRRKSLTGPTRRLASEIAARLGSDARMTAQGVRLTIGLAWLVLAIILFAKAGQFGGIAAASMLPPMPSSHAAALARIFFIAGIPATLLAVMVAFYVNVTRGNNGRVRAAGDALGTEIAVQASALDQEISGLINHINRDGDSAQAVDYLSRAQLKAFEAQSFFRQVRFLTPDTYAQSIDDLRAFLSGGGKVAPGGVFFVAFFLGGFLSWILFGNHPKATGAAPDIMQYPQLFLTLLFGGGLYLVAGLLCDLLIPTFGATRQRSMEDALDAVRSAFTARNAPRRVEMVRRVDDAMGVVQARLRSLEADAARGRTAGQQNPLRSNAPGAKRVAEPRYAPDDWRNRDTSAQFVDAGFQAAPTPFELSSESIRPLADKPRYKKR